MNHRKREHPTDKVFRYFKEGKCSFSDSECWYAHEKTPQGGKTKPSESEDFLAATRNLPPDMKKIIDQIIIMASKTMN